MFAKINAKVDHLTVFGGNLHVFILLGQYQISCVAVRIFALETSKMNKRSHLKIEF